MSPTSIKDALIVASSVTGSKDIDKILEVLHQNPEILKENRKTQRCSKADIMVGIATASLVSTLVFLVLFPLSGEVIGVLSMLCGIFGGCLKDAYAFEFGSSRGSRNKDESVNLLIKKSFS